MSPQRSNRARLLEGALRCLETGSVDAITARDIAQAAEANLASIGYHFGSKDGLLSEAMAEGFRRWLAEFAAGLAALPEGETLERIRLAIELLGDTLAKRRGLARAFLSAVARAPHDARVREPLAASYRESRLAVVQLLGLGNDQAGSGAASLLLAAFDGLLIQAVVEPERPLPAEGLTTGIDRLRLLTQEPRDS